MIHPLSPNEMYMYMYVKSTSLPQTCEKVVDTWDSEIISLDWKEQLPYVYTFLAR